METPKRSKRDWSTITSDWYQSGMTVANYCKTHTLAASGFYAAKSIYGSKEKRSAVVNISPRLIDVTSSQPTTKPPIKQTTPTLRPLFVVDDRVKVVKIWRGMGLVCLQCAKGDF